MFSLRRSFRELQTFFQMPTVSIDLRLRDVVGEDEFFEKITRDFYGECTRRHPKCPLIPYFKYGVAFCELPQEFDTYFMAIDASARRNYKKAVRKGYQFQGIRFNDHLDEISEIRRSATVRQGKLSDELLKEVIDPIDDPDTPVTTHGYPYYGAMKDGKLYAYSAVQIAGEFAMISHVYGHSDYQSDAMVPMMYIDIAKQLIEEHPTVKYYGYGSWFGASLNLKRFKRKFLFDPHTVKWNLGETAPATETQPLETAEKMSPA